MGRGYSASRSSSKRPTLRLKRERSVSMSNLRKSIDARAAKRDSAEKPAVVKSHTPSTSTDVMRRAPSSVKGASAKAEAAASVPPAGGQRAARSRSARQPSAQAQRSASKTLRMQLADMEEDLASELEASEDERETIAKPDVMVKYKTIGKVVDEVLDILAAACVPGASTKALCDQGDLEITSRLKALFTKTKDAQGRKLQRGLCYPTNISVGDVVCNHSPFREEEAVRLQPMQVVKLHCGCHLDGYPVMAARTIVVGSGQRGGVSNGAGTVPGSHAAALSKSGSNAIEAARVALAGMIRMLRPGTLNADVTDFIAAVGHSYGAEAIEGVLSNRVKRWVLDGVDCIIARRVIDTVPQHDVGDCEVGEHQVWALDVAFTNRLGTDDTSMDDGTVANEEEEKGGGKASPASAPARDRALSNADDTKCFRTTPTEEAACIYRRTPMEFATDARVQQANEVLTEITNRFGCFPFHFKHLSNPLRGKMGVNVLVKHQVVDKMAALRVKNSLSGRRIAARFSATVAVTGKRITVLCGAPPEAAVGAGVLPTELQPQPITGQLPEVVAERLRQPLEFATAAALRLASDGQPSAKRSRPE